MDQAKIKMKIEDFIGFNEDLYTKILNIRDTMKELLKEKLTVLSIPSVNWRDLILAS